MVKFEKKDVSLYISIALTLAILINIQLVAGIPDLPPWKNEDTETVGGSGWSLTAYVQGYFYYQSPYGLRTDWLYHEGRRAAWYSIIYIGTINVTAVSNKYSDPLTGTGDSVSVRHDQNWPPLPPYNYGRTRSWSKFHDWLTKQTWAAYAPSQTGWAEIPYDS